MVSFLIKRSENMDKVTAERISKKVRAFKHCCKLLTKIDKNGVANVPVNCTGMELTVRKGDAIYLQLQTLRASYAEEINNYQIVTSAREASTAHNPVLA